MKEFIFFMVKHFLLKTFFKDYVFFNRRSPLSELEIYCNKIIFVLLYVNMNEFWVWFKKISHDQNCFYCTLQEGRRPQWHRSHFRKEATTAQNRASGNRVTDSTGNAFMGGHPNPTPPPQRESKKCTVHFNTTRLLFCE